MIAIFYEGHSNPNGALAYMQHLTWMLESHGHTVNVFNVRNRTNTRQLCTGNYIHSVTADEAVSIANTNPSLILQLPEQPDQTYGHLLELGLPVVLHSGPGDKSMQLRLWSHQYSQDTVILVYGFTVQQQAQLAGYSNVIHLPQPYIRTFNTYKRDVLQYNAIAPGRVSSEKNTHLICQANELLPADKKIKICGVVSGRMYEYYKLRRMYPNWRDDYLGAPHNLVEKTTVELCRQAKFGIDMTVFDWEGGRPQYVTLEMLDAGCIVVMHEKWASHQGSMKTGLNCLTAGNYEELADLVQQDYELDYTAYDELLTQHAASAIVPVMMEVINARF
jgi:hypothetical protein